MDTIFKDAIAPTPDVNGGHEGTRGGHDIRDGRKETPGTVIGTLPTLTSVKDAPSGGQGSDFDVIAHHKAGLTFKG